MTGSMNSKFVSAGSSQDAAEAKSGVGEEDEEVKDAKKAAKMKMYGKLTRERVEWHPAKILCIRFAQHSLTKFSASGILKLGNFWIVVQLFHIMTSREQPFLISLSV